MDRLNIFVKGLLFFSVLAIAVVGSSFIGETNNNSPQESTSTKSTTDICQHCECSSTGKEINCTGRQLSDNLADLEWPRSNIELVTFENNAIIHIDKFPNITMSKLILSYNKISKIDQGAFKAVANLTDLDLSHNSLVSSVLRPEIFQGGFSPVEWQPLDQLHILNLGHNNLHTLNQDLFEHVTNLKVLILSGNPLTLIDHSTQIAIGNLINLEELDLSNCELEQLPGHFFHESKYALKRLSLHGNRFMVIPRALENTQVLEYLNLNENSMRAVEGSHVFPHLPKLKELKMQSLLHLTNIGAGAFAHLDALEYLYLDNCPNLTRIDEEAFIRHTNVGDVWPPLKVLDISNDALRNLAPTLLKHWEQNKLERLELENNQWACDCDNQYFISEFLPKLLGDNASKLFCSSPPEYTGKKLMSLVSRTLRCQDFYGARPERDAALLVGLMIGLLLAIPIALSLFLLWRRGYFFCSRQNPANFSRVFYIRTSNNEDL